MERPETVERPGVIVDAGIDWITAFAANGDARKRLLDVADSWVCKDRNAGQSECPASRFGFEGYRGSQWFFGTRPDGAIGVLSGSLASLAGRELMAVSTNVSRIDFQVTYALDYTDLNVALNEFNRLQSMPNKRGRPHGYQLIYTQPEGQTLNVNKRSSDLYGRLYDKGSESRRYAAGKLWRWELECKRRSALHHAMVCRQHTNLATYSTRVVKAFYHGKGLEPGWSNEVADLAGRPQLNRLRSNPLHWFHTTVRQTVQRAVSSHGIKAVVEALGMDQMVQVREEMCDGDISASERFVAP